MPKRFLDFEQPIAELEEKISALRTVGDDTEINIQEEIGQLEQRSRELTDSIFANLTPWQVAKVARHPERPYTLDYVARLVTEFRELKGDRQFADDPSIVAGIGRLRGRPVMLIGHQKGRNTNDNLHVRNFGMSRPEGYRKARRLMRLAERFALPVVTFIDTPGAYPGIDAERRGQSEAIAGNLAVMAELRTPIVSVVIGEGGSGGALAIGVCDCLVMLEYSTYSVISPEGCASILWKSAERAEDAAAAMGITARSLKQHELVDRVLDEPAGGAHRDVDAAAATVGDCLEEVLEELTGLSVEELLQRRETRLLGYGEFRSAS